MGDFTPESWNHLGQLSLQRGIQEPWSKTSDQEPWGIPDLPPPTPHLLLGL